MTAADRRDAGAIAAQPSRRADLGIGNLTVRGRGLSPTTGRSLATAVAVELARQLPVRNARLDAISILLPASALDPSGGVDRTALTRAIARARPDADA
jgi:hypothetical protein